MAGEQNFLPKGLAEINSILVSARRIMTDPNESEATRLSVSKTIQQVIAIRTEMKLASKGEKRSTVLSNLQLLSTSLRPAVQLVRNAEKMSPRNQELLQWLEAVKKQKLDNYGSKKVEYESKSRSGIVTKKSKRVYFENLITINDSQNDGIELKL
jgi:hypothetical protein